MKTKYFFLAAACLLFVTTIYSQPQRIWESDTYWEVKGDTIVFTGNGRIGYISNRPLPWGSYKKNIKYAIICEGITFIPYGTLSYCYKLVNVSLPQSLNSIGMDAFYKDSNLKYIALPNNLDSIGQAAFYLTGLHDTLKFPENVFFIYGSSFTFNKITHVEVPYKVDTLYEAFQRTTLSSAILPAGLRHMRTAFCLDSLLRTIVCLATVPPTFYHPHEPTPADPSGYRGHTFYEVNRSGCRLIVPTSAVETYRNTPVWQDFMIEAGGLSVGVCFNDKRKGNVEGLGNRFYKKGEKVSLQAVPRGQCTFSGWKNPDGKVISTANPLVFTVTQDTMLQACFEGEVSVREAEQTVRTGDNVMLFPNPAGDRFSVRSDAAVKELTLYDLSGRQLMQKENAEEMDISALPQGIYLVRVRTDKGGCMKKLVKE